jgi:ribose 5-phosphate isomerase RpiB
MADIERIVREVLAELGLASGTDASPRSSETPSAPLVPALAGPATVAPEPPGPAQTDGDLLVEAKVVTMAELAGRLDSARRVVVQPLAIVTPAVRDELRRRNVTLTVAVANNGRPTAGIRLVMVVGRTKYDPAALAKTLEQGGVQADLRSSDCLIASTDQLAAEVLKPNTLGALLTRHTAAGLCLANRHPGVRAVLGSDVHSASAAVAAIGANVLVVNPRECTAFQGKQMLADFCRGGIRECPEALKKRIG